MAMPLIDDQPLDHVFYPESDDEPMAENHRQAEIIRTLILGFQRLYAGRPDVLVGGDNFWYPVKGQPTIAVAPDTMVVVDLPKPPDTRTMGSYRQWEFGGRVALAIEVLSPSNTWAEMVRKRQFYDRHGVAEYWAFDPETGGLEAWMREGASLRELLVGDDGFVSPATGVTVKVVDGELVVADPGGQRRWLCPLDEAMRAEVETARADEATKRVRQLEARLAALQLNSPGDDPP